MFQIIVGLFVSVTAFTFGAWLLGRDVPASKGWAWYRKAVVFGVDSVFLLMGLYGSWSWGWELTRRLS